MLVLWKGSISLPAFAAYFSLVMRVFIHHCGALGVLFASTLTHLRSTGLFKGASLVAQVVKSLPAMLEIQVQSLGRENPLEKEGNGYLLQYSWLENSMDRRAW